MSGLAFLVVENDDLSPPVTQEEEDAFWRRVLGNTTFTVSKHGVSFMQFEIYDREDGKVGVRFEGANGEIMFGTQGYASEGNARRAIKRLKQGVKDAPVVRIKKEKTDGAA